MSIVADLSAELRATVETVKKSVFLVGDEKTGWRSGVSVGDNEIVTIARWADDGESVPVITPSGEKASATVKGFDMATGLTLLQGDNLSSGSVQHADAAPLVGQLAVTVAYPSPEGHEATLGMIRCVGSNGHDGAYYQTDGEAFPGFEGALVVSHEGHGIGLVGRTGRRRDDYIMPMQIVTEKADHLREHGSTTTGYLGVRTETVEAPKGVDGDSALLVVGVEEGSPAESSGILVGDILAGADGTTIENHEDLMSVLSTSRGSDQIAFSVVRGGENVTVSVVPGRRRASYGGHKHHRGRRGRRRP